MNPPIERYPLPIYGVIALCVHHREKKTIGMGVRDWNQSLKQTVHINNLATMSRLLEWV